MLVFFMVNMAPESCLLLMTVKLLSKTTCLEYVTVAIPMGRTRLNAKTGDAYDLLLTRVA